MAKRPNRYPETIVTKLPGGTRLEMADAISDTSDSDRARILILEALAARAAQPKDNPT
jgi:hypothetical protein